jgi:hypothetical protein
LQFWGPDGPFRSPESLHLQLLLDQFPAQINRENILKNREFKTKNRELAG